MKENMYKDWKKVLELWFGIMEENMLENGKKDSSMVMANISIVMEQLTKVFGNLVSCNSSEFSIIVIIIFFLCMYNQILKSSFFYSKTLQF